MSIEQNTILLINASVKGDVDEVRRLIPVSDPKYSESGALFYAAKNGHTQCVALLIPVSKPKANKSSALMVAVAYGNISCVELLYPVSDPIAALNTLKDEYPDNPNKWTVLEQMIEAKRLNTVLNAVIDDPDKHTNKLKVQRKM